MYAAVKQKKAKVIGREASRFINKTALVVTGIFSVIFAAVYKLRTIQPPSEFSERQEQARQRLNAIQAGGPVLDIFVTRDMLNRHRENRNIRERVYEVFKATHRSEQKTEPTKEVAQPPSTSEPAIQSN